MPVRPRINTRRRIPVLKRGLRPFRHVSSGRRHRSTGLDVGLEGAKC
jgi:hypothetical protein